MRPIRTEFNDFQRRKVDRKGRNEWIETILLFSALRLEVFADGNKAPGSVKNSSPPA